MKKYFYILFYINKILKIFKKAKYYNHNQVFILYN